MNKKINKNKNIRFTIKKNNLFVYLSKEIKNKIINFKNVYSFNGEYRLDVFFEMMVQ